MVDEDDGGDAISCWSRDADCSNGEANWRCDNGSTLLNHVTCQMSDSETVSRPNYVFIWIADPQNHRPTRNDAQQVDRFGITNENGPITCYRACIFTRSFFLTRTNSTSLPCMGGKKRSRYSSLQILKKRLPEISNIFINVFLIKIN